MRRLLPTRPALALAAALACAAAASRADPATAPTDAIADLQTAYALAVRPGAEADMYRELVATVLQRVARGHASEVDLDALAAGALKVVREAAPAADPRELFNKAINTALGGLDPYTRYLDARAAGNERANSQGSFGGLGLEVAAGDGAVRVVAAMPGTPAARAGLLSGDLIVRVDDQAMQGVSLADAIAKMRGEPGTPVAITVRRGGQAEDFTVSLTRETIRRQAVRWNMEGEVLVLQLSSFSGSVAHAMREAIVQATAAHAPRAVVLDLRGNPGGLVREAVAIADLFLAQGDIVTVRGRGGKEQRTWKAGAAELLAGLPLAVLVDRRSASASELLAAALQDHGRAIVLGQRSFGKGTVQTTFSLGPEARGAIKLTTSHYHRPAGPTVQRTGVAPDIELVAARAGDAVEATTHPMARVDPARCPAPQPAADAGLACAIAYLQAGNVQRFVARLVTD